MTERFTVIVKPNAKKTKILDFDSETKTYHIAVKAPPEKGKANIELLKFLKKWWGEVRLVSGQSQKLQPGNIVKVRLVSGHKSKKKIVLTNFSSSHNP